MQLTMPARANSPATSLYVDVLTKASAQKRPVIFMLPGGPGADHSMYKKHSGSLVEVADMVFFDPRGCGQSEKGDPISYTMENYIEDVEEIRKQLNFSKIIVLGTSYGSIVAIGYALRYLDHLEKLILVTGAPSYRFLAVAKKNLLERGTPEQIKIAEKLWTGSFTGQEDLREYFRLLAPLYSNKAKADPSASPFSSERYYNYEALNLGFKDFLRSYDYEPHLHKITCKTLICAGKDDWINDPCFGQLMAEKIPNSHLCMFSNSGHLIAIDENERYLQEIMKFIKK